MPRFESTVARGLSAATFLLGSSLLRFLPLLSSSCVFFWREEPEWVNVVIRRSAQIWIAYALPSRRSVRTRTHVSPVSVSIRSTACNLFPADSILACTTWYFLVRAAVARTFCSLGGCGVELAGLRCCRSHDAARSRVTTIIVVLSMEDSRF